MTDRGKSVLVLVKVFALVVDKQFGHLPVHFALTAVMAKPARLTRTKRCPMPADRASMSHVRALIRKESVTSDDIGAKETFTQICSVSERICQFGKELEELPSVGLVMSSNGASSDGIDHNVKRTHARGSGMLDPAAIHRSTDATSRTMPALPRHTFGPLAVPCVDGIR